MTSHVIIFRHMTEPITKKNTLMCTVDTSPMQTYKFIVCFFVVLISQVFYEESQSGVRRERYIRTTLDFSRLAFSKLACEKHCKLKKD